MDAGQRVRRRREKRLRALERTERHLPITFSIVGVQKAATSTLYMMLVKHPAVASGPEKEMRFFMMEDVDWEQPDYSHYVRPARRKRARVAGDATPEYLFWPHALERMHRYQPDMRLVGTFRDPIERAYSQWSMQRDRDPGFPDLRFASREWAHPRIPDEVPAGLTPLQLRQQSLFTRGLYGQQVRRGMGIFPAEQWLCLDFREVHGDHERTLDRVTDHLGVPRFGSHPELIHRNATPSHHTGPAPTADDIARLVDLFAPDLEEFARLSGVDVGGWSTSRVANGDLAADELAERLAAKVGLSTDG